MLLWLRIESEFYGVSSHIGRTRTTKKGVALVSDDTCACRSALSRSSGSYSGLAMQEFVNRNMKEYIIAPKTVSSGDVEQ